MELDVIPLTLNQHYMKLTLEAERTQFPPVNWSRKVGSGVLSLVTVPSIRLPGETDDGTHRLNRSDTVSVCIVPVAYGSGGKVATRLVSACLLCHPGLQQRLIFIAS